MPRRIDNLAQSGLLRLVLAVLLAGAIAGPAAAADHYVDNAATGAGNGRSWETAWRSFAQIDWRAVRPGDTVHISGGTNGRVYQEMLTVGASGKGNRPIVIQAAVAAGHAGEVVIDAQNLRDYGVVVDSRNHVTVRGMTVRNVGDAGVRVRWSAAGVVIEAMSVEAGNPTSVESTRGYDVRNSKRVVIRDSAYSTPTSSTAQTDGIFSTNNNGVRFENNRLIIANSYAGANQGHNDCIQSFQDKNIEVIGNYCEQRNTKTDRSQGIFIQDLTGTAQVLNNVIVSPNTNSPCISIENRASSPNVGRMLAYNNSAYGCAFGTLHIGRSPKSVARNNILVSPKANAQAMKVVPPAPRSAQIDYNLLYTPNSSRPVMVEGAGLMSWAEWRGLGYERNGINADPLFVDPAEADLTLRTGSPAIDRAVQVKALTDDIAGTTRPQGPGYDIGAFEHAASAGPRPVLARQ